jgi:hypothetical protein
MHLNVVDAAPDQHLRVRAHLASANGHETQLTPDATVRSAPCTPIAQSRKAER